jgi:hypothetical protein
MLITAMKFVIQHYSNTAFKTLHKTFDIFSEERVVCESCGSVAYCQQECSNLGKEEHKEECQVKRVWRCVRKQELGGVSW